MHIFWLICLMAAAVAGTLPTASSGSEESRQWVDSVYNAMTPRQRVAQLFVPRLDISDNASGRAEITRMVQAGVGGFLLGKGTVDGYASLINLAQSEARVPLLVTLDGEWGLAMRVEGTPRFPYNMALGAISDPELLDEYGREVARECRELGIHVDFAPVMDVNSNPANPVIGYRSFGENPERVATLGTAYARGMESAGVLTTAKHFPGHGDTSVDSHKSLPVINKPEKALTDVELLPFRSYIEAGLSGVMVGHLSVPALDASGTPASMSSAIITDLLKKKMGFKGLVWTDALAMKGAGSTENNCVRALRAGADVLLGSGNPLGDISAVCEAIDRGVISRASVDERCRKILAYKYALGLTSRPAPIDAAVAKLRINSPEAEAVNRRLSAAAITCLKNGAGLLPLRGLRQRSIAVLSLGAPAANPFSETCLKYAQCTLVGSADGSLTSSQIAELRRHDVVVVAVMADSKAARESFARLDGIADVVPVFFLNPYKMAPYASSIARHKTLVAACDNTPLLEQYAAQAIFGGIDVGGRFPVGVKGVAREGDGVDIDRSRLGFTSPAAAGISDTIVERFDAIVADAIAEGAFPGCQIVVVKGPDVVIDKAWGYTTRTGDDAGRPTSTSTLYDIASMTKATATVAGVMKAVDEGLLDLDGRLADYIAETDMLPIGDVTISDLLFHQSGLPASINMFRLMTDTATYTAPLTSAKYGDPYTVKIDRNLYGNRNARLRRDLVSATPSADCDLAIGRDLYVGQAALDTIMARIYALVPGERRYRYSDINFCLLMAAEEAATGVAHDQWVDLEVFRPLGAWHTLYRPSDLFPPAEIAPTEDDLFLRRQRVHGYVHDETAAFSGGVQGNAGLFSTALDVAKLCRLWLGGGSYGGEQLFSPDVVSRFMAGRTPLSRRGLGFDRMSSPPAAATAGVFGHTGFTGTCFWVDPENEIIFVFLSNRVNPSRDNPAFAASDIRRRLFDEIYRWLR